MNHAHTSHRHRVPRGQIARLVILASLFFCAAEGRSNEVRKSPEELTAAAAHGDAEAQYLVARALLLGKELPKDPERAYELMKKSAGQEHPDALGGMGYFFANGVVVPKDEIVAIEWFRKGTAKGSIRAQLNLALFLANGKGGPKDEVEGLRLIDAAAATGHRDALYAQGETYFYGQFGRPIDYPKAYASLNRAAQAGHVAAQNTIGVMLRDGHGVERNNDQAIEWFRKAADQGDARGQSNLGHLLGVDSPDRARRMEALKWVILAAGQKEVTAVKTLEELQLNIAAADLEEAQKAADEFRSQPSR